MSKRSGMGMLCIVGGYDLSNDIGSFSRIGGGLNGTQDVTGVDKSAFERVGLGRTGSVDYGPFFNPAVDRAHARFKLLPTADVILTGTIGQALGGSAFSINSKQINYDPTRAADGQLTNVVSAQSNTYGLEWGTQVTAGLRTDTGATSGTGVDFGTGTTNFGLQAYLQVTGFTGTDATIKLQSSTDDGAGDAYADVTAGAFTAVTAAHVAQRIETARNAAIERWLRVVTTTSAGFTSLTFLVMVARNDVSVVF